MPRGQPPGGRRARPTWRPTGGGSTRGCCWSTWSRRPSGCCPVLFGIIILGRSNDNGQNWFEWVFIPLVVGRRAAALPHDPLPHHQRPDRAAERVAEQADPRDTGRPGPHRRRHVVADPPGPRAGQGRARHRGHRARRAPRPRRAHPPGGAAPARGAHPPAAGDRGRRAATTGIPAGLGRAAADRRAVCAPAAGRCAGRCGTGRRHRDRAAAARPAVGPLRAGDDDRGRLGAGDLRLREPVHHPRPRAGRPHRGGRPDRRLRVVGRLDRRGRRGAGRRHRAVGHRLRPAVLGVPADPAQRRHAAHHPGPAHQPRVEHRGEADPRPRGRRAARAATRRAAAGCTSSPPG